MSSNGRLTRFSEVLRCPNCHESISVVDESMNCSSCSAQFPIVGNVPLLMNSESESEQERRLNTDEGRKMVAEYAQSGDPDTAKKRSFLSSVLSVLRPPDIQLDYRFHTEDHPLTKIWEKDQKSQLTLNVGGGPIRESNSGDEITMNLKPFYNVDLVGDAHNIPAMDNSFDSILSMSVLEHVNDPKQVAQEMMRVLKPGGTLYTEVPFILFYHGYPADYTRWTREGIRQLFPGLEDVDIGMTKGPVSAALQSVNSILLILFSSRSTVLRKISSGIFRWLFFLFKYLDLLIRNNPDAHMLAGGFYIAGKKPQPPK